MSSSRNGSEKDAERNGNRSKLRLADKIWVAVAIAIFVIAFAIILIFGVF